MVTSEVHKLVKKKKTSQIDVNNETNKSKKGEEVGKKPKKPKIYGVID